MKVQVIISTEDGEILNRFSLAPTARDTRVEFLNLSHGSAARFANMVQDHLENRFEFEEAKS